VHHRDGAHRLGHPDGHARRVTDARWDERNRDTRLLTRVSSELTSGHNSIFPVVAGVSLPLCGRLKPATTMLLRACAHLCPDVSSKRLTSPHAPAIVTLVMKQAIRSDEFYAYFTPLVLSAGVVVRD